MNRGLVGQWVSSNRITLYIGVSPPPDDVTRGGPQRIPIVPPPTHPISYRVTVNE